ncbi:hypothetical protein CTheo_2177 [Ceratobasidium theobromae]|uniref:Uncharacterized protein n=1 Tax=Ceratobasidium theobromae TaxID=1582974 RepID=A0A5N5QRM6_9AGAM|nr:hypothetical protein CTheo_2177 [Ceratobasidium theobromae]
MPNYGSPSSSVSSLSSSGDIVFSSPALAATRDNEVVIDFSTEEDSEHGNVFGWPAVESPAAHAPAMRPTRTRSSETQTSRPQSTSDRWRHSLVVMSREAEQAHDPNTSLARRIAARESARQSQSQSSTSEPTFPTARLLSRTVIPVSEPEPPADLRRLATTREAERQLHYRDWHRLGLFDPSSSVGGSDNATVSPGRLIPSSVYPRRRSRLPPPLDQNGDEHDDEGTPVEIPHRLHRRISSGLISDAQLEREHDAASSRTTDQDRRLSRSRISILGGRSFSRFAWHDGLNDPNGEHFGDDDTPAARSRYWNARTSSATDDLLSLAILGHCQTTESGWRLTSPPSCLFLHTAEILALLTRLQSSAAAERQQSPAPATPPGLRIPENERSAAAEPRPPPISNSAIKPDPLPIPLESMLLPTPRQRFIAAFKAGPSSPS